MNILFLGDVIGRPGRQILKQELKQLRLKNEADLVIANGDNLAGGIGHTPETVAEIVDAGVDLVTSGNHWTAKKESLAGADDPSLPFILPANYRGKLPGRGFKMLQVRTKKILVINLLGEIFMNEFVDDPLTTFDKILEEEKTSRPDVILVDFHAEATAEKNLFGYYVDGRATAMLGTHTHVPTADAVVMPKGAGYISDVGMVGSRNSIIGFEPKDILQSHFNSTPLKLTIPKPTEVCINYAMVHTAGKPLNDQTSVEKCGSILQKTEVLKLI